MRILIVATKSPWPPVDGGRLALWNTMTALAAAGHGLALVAPTESAADPRAIPAELAAIATCRFVAVQRPSWPTCVLRAVTSGRPLAIERHRHAAVAEVVAALIGDFRPDVIHVEQLQALASAEDAAAGRVPVVLRMQNVESDLWRQLAAAQPLRPWLALEARRLARYEQAAAARVARVVALTAEDGAVLAAALPPEQRGRVGVVPPPFDAVLPAAAAVTGAPALLLSGSAGWFPNRDALAWFERVLLPAIEAVLPGSRLHCYGDGVSGLRVEHHASPAESIDAFPAGGVVLLPLRIASGIRMRILEAFARGLPVVATTIAARGLPVADRRELMIADDAEGFVAALRALSSESGLAQRLAAAGHDVLRREHAAAPLVTRLIAVYSDAVATASS